MMSRTHKGASRSFVKDAKKKVPKISCRDLKRSGEPARTLNWKQSCLHCWFFIGGTKLGVFKQGNRRRVFKSVYLYYRVLFFLLCVFSGWGTWGCLKTERNIFHSCLRWPLVPGDV